MNRLLPPIVLLILITLTAIYFRPLMIIDETRYIGVAWEMFSSKNYLVPHLNGLPYDHKPPLLFWLICLDWSIFGVNEFSVRLIPLLFAIGVVILGDKIYRLLWSDDSYGAEILPWVLVGSVVFAFYSTLLMFDIMLSFWVALAIYAGIKAAKEDSLSSYLLLAFAIGFGILAKSPVVVAPLLPLYLFASYWSPKRVKISFYTKGFIAVLVGVAIALIWAIPAAKLGGKEYAYGIFWGQYAGRAVNSFAHKHPFWWYLPWIPIILMPWFLYSNFWAGLKEIKNRGLDKGLKVLTVWIVGSLVIFSIISGKQLAYIAPEFLAFSLLATRALSISRDNFKRAYLIALIFILLGLAFAIAPWFIKGYIRNFLDSKAFLISSILLVSYGLFLLFYKFKTQKELIKVLSLNSFLLILSIHFIANIYLLKQDLHNFSNEISKLQKSGKRVAHLGKYANEYQFMGRLKKPLIVLKNDKDLKKFIKENPNGAIIVHKKREIKFNKDATIAVTKFRTQNSILVKSSNWGRLLK